MKERKLEDLLEECLSAYLEEGRPVEESLAVHSAYRGLLDPLLRTGVEVADAFASCSPPVAVQQRGLERFVSDARARARLRTLRSE